MERDLRKVDWSLVVVDTNSIGLARKHHQKLIGAQAVNRRRASREIVAASKLSRQTIHRHSSGIADHQHRQSATQRILRPGNFLRAINNTPRTRCHSTAHRRLHLRQSLGEYWRWGDVFRTHNSPPPPNTSTSSSATTILNSSRSLIRTGRRRIIGHRAVSRRRDQSRRAANPITPASSSRANFLTTPDHSVQPAHRRRQNRRLQAGGRTGTGTPESTMAKTPAPEAASLVGAGRGTVIRRETVEAPPTEIRRDAAPWSAFSPQTSLTRTLAFLHLPPVARRRRGRVWKATGENPPPAGGSEGRDGTKTPADPRNEQTGPRGVSTGAPL